MTEYEIYKADGTFCGFEYTLRGLAAALAAAGPGAYYLEYAILGY